MWNDLKNSALFPQTGEDANGRRRGMLANRLTIFHKIVLFIVLLLIPIVGLYVYSNQVSVSIIRNEIRDAIANRLSFLQNRLNLQIDLLSKGAFQLGGDPILKSYGTIEGFESYFDVIDFKKKVEDRITVQNNTSDWRTETTVYFPESRQAVSPTEMAEFDEAYLADRVASGWSTRPVQDGETAEGYRFYFYAVSPFAGYADPRKADQIVEMSFSDQSLVALLDDYKATGEGDPFLFRDGLGVIPNRTRDRSLTGQVAALMEDRPLRDFDSFTAELAGSSYLVTYIRTNLDGWTIVDYVPMQQVLSPIVSSNRLFYVSTLLLLLMSLFAAFMLYRNVQIPIRTLVKSLRLVMNGEFSTRIQPASNSEFRFVFQRFNDMTEQIQRLIDNVYTEQLRARDAQLKQLQSQIKPHFLYNCLYFIVNMARLERLEPIEKMAVNLGRFFKYTTRLEKPDTSVAEELQVIGNYLEIQKLRLNRIDYAIEVPNQVLVLEIPRLLLQPVVENAVVHGIEPKPGGGSISITGGIDDGGRAWIEVADNGVGMTEEHMLSMMQQLRRPVTETTGYGVWNVHQRLALRFGGDAGVSYRVGKPSGCIARLTWNPHGDMIGEGENGDVPGNDR